mgnify:CR=1 FL=1
MDPVPDKFQQAAATGDGPDIVMFAHDRFGDWAAGGLIDPVTPVLSFASPWGVAGFLLQESPASTYSASAPWCG